MSSHEVTSAMKSVSLYIVIYALFTLGYKCKYNGHILAINYTVANKNNKNVCERVRFSKARTVYYANTTATLRLILSGDVEQNPGPAKCPSCNKTVRSNSKQLDVLFVTNRPIIPVAT